MWTPLSDVNSLVKTLAAGSCRMVALCLRLSGEGNSLAIQQALSHHMTTELFVSAWFMSICNIYQEAASHAQASPVVNFRYVCQHDYTIEIMRTLTGSASSGRKRGLHIGPSPVPSAASAKAISTSSSAMAAAAACHRAECCVKRLTSPCHPAISIFTCRLIGQRRTVGKVDWLRGKVH